MDTKHQPTVEPTDEKPVAVAHLEDKSELGPDKHAGVADYTGAEAKTDPEEIALVRKIDWRLMVRMLELDVGTITNMMVANVVCHVLLKLR
jgi:hypothetical protein